MWREKPSVSVCISRCSQDRNNAAVVKVLQEVPRCLRWCQAPLAALCKSSGGAGCMDGVGVQVPLWKGKSCLSGYSSREDNLKKALSGTTPYAPESVTHGWWGARPQGWRAVPCWILMFNHQKMGSMWCQSSFCRQQLLRYCSSLGPWSFLSIWGPPFRALGFLLVCGFWGFCF